MKNKIKAFIRNQDGLTIVEYAVAGGLIAATVAAAFTALGGTVQAVITTLDAAIGGVP